MGFQNRRLAAHQRWGGVAPQQPTSEHGRLVLFPCHLFRILFFIVVTQVSDFQSHKDRHSSSDRPCHASVRIPRRITHACLARPPTFELPLPLPRRFALNGDLAIGEFVGADFYGPDHTLLTGAQDNGVALSWNTPLPPNSIAFDDAVEYTNNVGATRNGGFNGGIPIGGDGGRVVIDHVNQRYFLTVQNLRGFGYYGNEMDADGVRRPGYFRCVLLGRVHVFPTLVLILTQDKSDHGFRHDTQIELWLIFCLHPISSPVSLLLIPLVLHLAAAACTIFQHSFLETCVLTQV
jgi:hypothetical protein